MRTNRVYRSGSFALSRPWFAALLLVFSVSLSGCSETSPETASEPVDTATSDAGTSDAGTDGEDVPEVSSPDVTTCATGAAECPCYPNDTCDAGLVCQDGVCAQCSDGVVGCPCGASGDCGDGVCVAGVCAPCAAGVIGCPCTDAGSCTMGRCDTGTCVACEDGVTGCPCTVEGACLDGLCTSGKCVPCAPGVVGCSCDGGTCQTGGYCEADVCVPCVAGVLGCPCGASGSCDDGICVSDTCVPCTSGVLGCPCEDSACTTGECVDGQCVDCDAGETGCACLPGSTCSVGNQCQGGVCVSCPPGSVGCVCGTGQVCGPGLLCQNGLCLDSGCAAGDLGCPCEGGVCADEDVVCDANVCVACSPWLLGCPCENGNCSAGLVCDISTDRCRAPLGCKTACQLHQLCDVQVGADPTCLPDCELGWQWQDGSCVAVVPPTCDEGVPGSLVEDCAAQNRVCDASADPPACGTCLEFFVDDGGTLETCRAVLTCTDQACAAQNRVCASETTDADAACTGCLPFHLEKDFVCTPVTTCESLPCAALNRTCVAETATSDALCGGCAAFFIGDADPSTTCSAVATCEALGCATQNRSCTAETATSNAVCDGCLPFFVDEESGCVPALTCEALNCAALNRSCTDETETSHGSCGGCLPGHVPDGEGCKDAPDTCLAGDPGDITASCQALNRKCVHLELQEASCGGCLEGFGLNADDECVEVVTCAALDCASLGRACEGAYPVNECGGCLVGTVVSQVDPTVCVPLTTCEDLTCGDGEFCLPGDGSSTSAECFLPTCDPGEAYSTFAGGCVSCTVSCGDDEGETGKVWPISLQNSSFCLCETKTNYYWEEGDDRSAQPCDADGDGWVRSSARVYLESSDASLRVNARCALRTVDRVVLQNELGQRLPLSLCEDDPPLRLPGESCDAPVHLPLYETPRNDDQVELHKDSLVPEWSADGVGRKVLASEVNPLTRACLSGSDLNDNDVTDLSEWHGMPKPSGMDPETYLFLQLSHYMELHTTRYEAGSGAGQLVIAERSRCDLDFPFDYESSGDYWRNCTRSRDVAFDATDGPAGPDFGLDFAAWSCAASAGGCPIPPPPLAEPLEPGSTSPPAHGFCVSDLVLEDEECAMSDSPWLCVDGAVWRGMSHHSQFRCVVVGDPSTVEPREATTNFYPFGEGQALLGSCHIDCPEGDPTCAADCADGTCTTSTESNATNPSAAVVRCPVNPAPIAGDVGFRMALFQPGELDYTRGCIDEWRPRDVVGDPTGAEDPEVAPWRALCPGWSGSPKTTIGEGSPTDFGRLQCGCGTRYGGPECRQGCPGDRLHVSEGYVSVPRAGLWLCGESGATTYHAVDETYGPAFAGGGFVLRGRVPQVPVERTRLTQPGPCDTATIPAENYGLASICGASPDCVSDASWAQARNLCEAEGMRLCTASELASQETRGTGCSFDLELVWSSTPCAGGFVTGYGNPINGPPECRDPEQETAVVRCCASVEVGGFTIH